MKRRPLKKKTKPRTPNGDDPQVKYVEVNMVVSVPEPTEEADTGR